MSFIDEDDEEFDMVFIPEDEDYEIIFICELGKLRDKYPQWCKYLKCTSCNFMIARDLPEMGLNYLYEQCPVEDPDCYHFNESGPNIVEMYLYDDENSSDKGS